MIFRLLTNANYLIYFFGIFVILMLLTYLIYKLFIVENDLFIVNEKINKIELEFNNPNGSYESLNTANNTKENFNLTDIIMNEVFNTPSNKNKNCSINGVCSMSDGSCKRGEEPASAIDLDLDTMIDKEVVSDKEEEKEKKVLFDLKKEIIVDDKESVISENNTKRKLQKLNLDKLKEKCVELNLSTEGTKAQVIDRILQES
jgi:hypothetical protein